MRILLILIVGILSACSNVKRTMGITQETPDEYTVIPNKKLEIPDSICLPEPDQDRAFLEQKPATEDTKTLLIQNVSSHRPPQDTKAEKALLQHLPTQPEPKIRVLVNKDNKKPDQWGQNLLFWQKQVKGNPLDAAAEVKRLESTHETVSPRS